MRSTLGARSCSPTGQATPRTRHMYRIWFVPGPNAFDVSRANVSTGDFNGDQKADLLALYDCLSTTTRTCCVAPAFVHTPKHSVLAGSADRAPHTSAARRIAPMRSALHASGTTTPTVRS